MKLINSVTGELVKEMPFDGWFAGVKFDVAELTREEAIKMGGDAKSRLVSTLKSRGIKVIIKGHDKHNERNKEATFDITDLEWNLYRFNLQSHLVK